jgi:hypothetical protein
MLRLVSLLGIACLAVAAVTLKSQSYHAAANSLDNNEDSADANHRLTVSVIPTVLPFHAPFSLN